jgi:AI-2 transport protein TqsA
VVIFLAFEAASMLERLGVIRETRLHIADGLENLATRVRNYWIVTTVFGFIVAVLDVIALAIIGVAYSSLGRVGIRHELHSNVGFILGVIPPALIALLDCGVGSAVAVVVLCTVINVVVQAIVRPRECAATQC